jgi:hypothetical protein
VCQKDLPGWLTHTYPQVTNFWDKDNFNPEKLKELCPELREENAKEPEYIQGKYLVEAAQKAGVDFFVWRLIAAVSSPCFD